MPPCCLAQLSSEACVTAVLTGKGPVKIPATPCDPVSYPAAESCQPTVELSTLPVLPAVFMGPTVYLLAWDVSVPQMTRFHVCHP